MIYAATRQEIEVRRKAFIRKWRLKHRAVSDSTECLTLEDGRDKVRTGQSWRNPGFSQSGSHPALCINRDDVKAYRFLIAAVAIVVRGHRALTAMPLGRSSPASPSTTMLMPNLAIA